MPTRCAAPRKPDGGRRRAPRTVRRGSSVGAPHEGPPGRRVPGPVRASSRSCAQPCLMPLMRLPARPPGEDSRPLRPWPTRRQVAAAHAAARAGERRGHAPRPRTARRRRDPARGARAVPRPGVGARAALPRTAASFSSRSPPLDARSSSPCVRSGQTSRPDGPIDSAPQSSLSSRHCPPNPLVTTLRRRGPRSECIRPGPRSAPRTTVRPSLPDPSLTAHFIPLTGRLRSCGGAERRRAHRTDSPPSAAH